MPDLKYTDLTYLKEVTGGETGFMKEMITIFMEQVPEFIENMEKHHANADYIDLGKEAHKAKSSVLILGMNDLATKMKELQILTEKNEAIEAYPSYIENFKTQCLGAVEELNREMDNL